MWDYYQVIGYLYSDPWYIGFELAAICRLVLMRVFSFHELNWTAFGGPVLIAVFADSRSLIGPSTSLSYALLSVQRWHVVAE